MSSDSKGSYLSAFPVATGKSLGRQQKIFPRLSYISLCNPSPRGSNDTSPIFRIFKIRQGKTLDVLQKAFAGDLHEVISKSFSCHV